jgi:hypothetical protein
MYNIHISSTEANDCQGEAIIFTGIIASATMKQLLFAPSPFQGLRRSSEASSSTIVHLQDCKISWTTFTGESHW